MTRSLILAAFGLSLVAPSLATELVSVTYSCERDVRVPVVFVNDDTGESHAIALIDSKLLTMAHVISASGARYRSGDGVDAYQLWIKGESAVISFGPDGQDQVLFSACTTSG